MSGGGTDDRLLSSVNIRLQRGATDSLASIRAATVRTCEELRYAGETACATTGKSFACTGGAGFSLPT